MTSILAASRLHDIALFYEIYSISITLSLEKNEAVLILKFEFSH